MKFLLIQIQGGMTDQKAYRVSCKASSEDQLVLDIYS
jgi:hypothetical protein